MPALFRRRWLQFRLRSLMALVVVICLALGGWHLLLTYGQWVEAEPAVVGQPIRMRGRFFDFFGRYSAQLRPFLVLLHVADASDPGNAYLILVEVDNPRWWGYDFEWNIDCPFKKPGEFEMTVTPLGNRPVHARGKFVVQPAE